MKKGEIEIKYRKEQGQVILRMEEIKLTENLKKIIRRKRC